MTLLSRGVILQSSENAGSTWRGVRVAGGSASRKDWKDGLRNESSFWQWVSCGDPKACSDH